MKSRERTLLSSCLLSVWAPAATGYAALVGKSVLLFSDFLRRTGEFAGLALALYTVRYIAKKEIADESRISSLESRSSFIVALIMLFSGMAMGIAAASRFINPQPTSNITLGLLVGLAGFLVNIFFFFRYRKLNHLQPGQILSSQMHLYYTKTITDLSIITSLALTKLLPSPYNYYVDPLASTGIMGLMLFVGFKTLKNSLKSKPALA